MSKAIQITASGDVLNFNVGLEDFNRFINETTPDNKVAPAKNFLMRTVDADSKEAVRSLCDQGLTMNLAGELVKEFQPKVEFEVKTLSGSLTA